MTSYPYWVTPAALQAKQEGDSFDTNPVQLDFGETADLPCKVSLLNGALPPGIRWEQQGFSVLLTGKIRDVFSTTDFLFTFRVDNGTYRTDLTFELTVTSTIDLLEWITPAGSIGYYYSAGVANYTIAAKNTPIKSVSYSVDLTSVTHGFTIENGSGLISLDLTWKSNTDYKQVTDFVFNNNKLYVCKISGKSGLFRGPIGNGNGIIDSTYPAWQPNSLYYLNNLVTNDSGKIYVCLTFNGISNTTGGPTGINDQINDGTLQWKYIGQAPVWNQVTAGTQQPLLFTVTAATSSSTVDRQFQIALLSRSYPPIWTTPAGLLKQVVGAEMFFYQLQVLDADFRAITFSSNNLPTWLNMSLLGELWGQLPDVPETTNIEFDITASDGDFSVDRHFIIQIVKDIVYLQWLSPNRLGTIKDGDFSQIQFSAKSYRQGARVSYALTGGTIPPNTIVINDTGMMSGFVEFHAQQRTYYFEITVSDGVDSQPQWFELTVMPQNLEKYLSLSIPITGRDKEEFISNNNNSIVNYKYSYLPDDTNWGRTQYPEINIINGVKYTTTSDVRDAISPWLHEFEIVLDQLGVTAVEQLPYQELFVTVRDANSCTPWEPFTSYNKGTKITNTLGMTFVATNDGISGDYPGPRNAANSVVDGSMTWSYQGGPLAASNSLHALPWYPHHYYTANQTVTNFGNQYITFQNGYSAGDLGPSGQQDAIDNEIKWIWQSSTTAAPNQEYISSIHSLRTVLEKLFGYATSKGTGAIGEVVVDSTTNGIGSVTMIDTGSGYFSQPAINLTGVGSGAVLSANLYLIGGKVVSSTSGFSIGDTFVVDQGNGDAGEISISALDEITGQVADITIINPGKFKAFPKTRIGFSSDNNIFYVVFDLGIGSIEVVNPGQGYSYSNTGIDFNGREILPDWQYQFFNGYMCSIPLSAITMAGSQSFSANLMLQNPYRGYSYPVRLIKMQIQGLVWEGNTTFDQDCMCFDGSQTRFIEFDPASQTVFDENKTVFENYMTLFDHGASATDDFSNTTLDHTETVIDHNGTLIDQRPVINYSLYSQSWLLSTGKPFE